MRPPPSCFLHLSLLEIPSASRRTGEALVATRTKAIDLYGWSLLLALSFSALLFALWKARDAPVTERRRARLFLAGLGIGLLPPLAAIMLEACVPAFARLMQDPQARLVERLILRPLHILSAVITAYSVLVNRILDIKLYLRRVIQYALTRWALLATAIAPFLLLAMYVLRRRDQSLMQLMSGSPVLLPLLGIAGIVGLRLRSQMSRLIDRRFFREQYDSKQILADLVARSREVRTAEDLAVLLESEIDRALHLDSIAVLYRGESTGELKSRTGGIRPLEATSSLAKLLAGAPEPMDVSLESQGEMLRRLRQEEREWISGLDSCLLVPLIASNGFLVGLIALGEKKSELPFSREDRLLLTAIAASAALTLENRLLLRTPPHGGDREPLSPAAPEAKEEPASEIDSTAAAGNAPSAADCSRPGKAPVWPAAAWLQSPRCPASCAASFVLRGGSALAAWGLYMRPWTWNSNARWQSRLCPESPPSMRGGSGTRPGRWQPSRIRTLPRYMAPKPGAACPC